MNNLGRCLLQRLILSAHHPSHILATTIAPASSPSLDYNAVRHSSSSSRQSKILRKLVAGKDKAKRRWYQDGPTTPKLQSAAALSNPARQGKNAPRRVHVLNKLFMKHITDLLSTGEASDAILGRGLQISHVKVSADFNYVNVFWSSTHSIAAPDTRRGAAAADDLEAVLRHVAGHLRHELSQLRLMGEVPRINFVRDRQVASDAAIDALLARADFGDDYQPVGWAQMRADLVVPQSQTMGAPLPAMRHDVLGVNQAEIMGKIRQTMAKSRQAWERYAEAAETNVTSSSSRNSDGDVVRGTMSISDVRAEIAEETRVRDEEFAKFLEQRRHARKRRSVKKNPDFNESYFRDEYDDVGDYGERFDQDFLEEDEPLR